MSHNTEWLTQQGQEDAIKEDVVTRLEAQEKIDHPPHYTFGTIEPIDVIEDWDLDYHEGCAVKYIARAGLKEGSSELEDLKKAQWYLGRKIQNLQTEEDADNLIKDLREAAKELKKEGESGTKEEPKLSPLQKLAKAMGLSEEKEQ